MATRPDQVRIKRVFARRVRGVRHSDRYLQIAEDGHGHCEKDSGRVAARRFGYGKNFASRQTRSTSSGRIKGFSRSPKTGVRFSSRGSSNFPINSWAAGACNRSWNHGIDLDALRRVRSRRRDLPRSLRSSPAPARTSRPGDWRDGLVDCRTCPHHGRNAGDQSLCPFGTAASPAHPVG